MLRQRLHRCVDLALLPLLPARVDEAAEKELLHPVVSIEHVHYIVDKLFDIYEPKVMMYSVENEGYYVRVADTPMVHPAYMLGTFIVLLLAKPKHIYVDSFLNCEGGEETYLGDPVTGRLLKYILKEFSEVVPFEKHEIWDTESGFRTVNYDMNITHVIEIGSQVEAVYRTQYYRSDITLHLPSANYVWVHFSSSEKIRRAKKFKKFGLYCFMEVFSYECDYDKSMNNIDDEESYVGITYFCGRDWKMFLERHRWYFSAEKIPIFIFGDVKPDLKILKEFPKCFKIVTQRKFNTDEIFYDFTNLLKRKEY